MEQAIIETRGLTKTYGSLKAVDSLDLSIGKGEIFGLLGPNGAGKSTTILMLLGLTEPTAGEARICGLNATRNPIAVKRKVGYMPDSVGFYNDLTALDNLVYIARLNGTPESKVVARAKEMLVEVGLEAAIHKKAGTFSRGMKQRLGLADVLIRQPEVIILDEPTLGIDPAGVKDFLELILQLNRRQGLTILLSSHHLHQVQQVCSRVGIFRGFQVAGCEPDESGDRPGLRGAQAAGQGRPGRRQDSGRHRNKRGAGNRQAGRKRAARHVEGLCGRPLRQRSCGLPAEGIR